MISSTVNPAVTGPNLAHEVGVENPIALRVEIGGSVQGIGFRPFVFRLAQELGLCGYVRNTSGGVTIHVEGEQQSVDRFSHRLAAAPGLDQIESKTTNVTGFDRFTVDQSVSFGAVSVRVPRDVAMCMGCQSELTSPSDRRFRHPFCTCIRCGPRYSIVESMPYDRVGTTMSAFRMCARCEREYSEWPDPRFHAETMACPHCGPRLEFHTDSRRVTEQHEALKAAAGTIRGGFILALKGLGGYQFLCRADSEEAVARLRLRKRRATKPFAVMVDSLSAAEQIAELDDASRGSLQSPENPIVLVPRAGNLRLAHGVAPNVGTIGLFLTTTPIHRLLLDELGFPVVATSGNVHEEPIAFEHLDAEERLAEIADAWLTHDRPILRPLDDSVVRPMAGSSTVLRVGRGFAPQPLPGLERFIASLADPVPPMLAVGGHQKVAVAIWTGAQAVLTQHLGDMDGPESRRLFSRTTGDLRQLYRFSPQTLVHDRHPDYFTTRWAHQQAVPRVAVQHHHAHAVSCMVDNNLLDREVVGIAFDGSGVGTDGDIWGGEILRVTSTRFARVGSLLPFRLPGGEAAIRQPARIALTMLADALGVNAILTDGWLLDRLGITANDSRRLLAMVQRQVNCPRTTSVGRLFDAIAALVIGATEVSYQGEAAARLEAAADTRQPAPPYPMPVLTDGVVGEESLCRADWRPMLRALIDDLRRGAEPPLLSSRFHATLATWAASTTERLDDLHDVVLTGGCFQNRLLTEWTIKALEPVGKGIHIHHSIPPNDGGLAVGQLAIAIAQHRSGR